MQYAAICEHIVVDLDNKNLDNSAIFTNFIIKIRKLCIRNNLFIPTALNKLGLKI